MTSLIESLKKGPVMIMTLKCETEFPKALKNLMLSMGMQGEAVYKGFPIMDEGEEYWWVQLHLCKDKEDDHKKMRHWMYTYTGTRKMTIRRWDFGCLPTPRCIHHSLTPQDVLLGQQ
jgi:hypothetical protein